MVYLSKYGPHKWRTDVDTVEGKLKEKSEAAEWSGDCVSGETVDGLRGRKRGQRVASCLQHRCRITT